METREAYLLRERDRVETSIRSLTERLADVSDVGAIDTGAEQARTANSQRLKQLREYLAELKTELNELPVDVVVATARGTDTIGSDESEYDE